MKPGNDVRVDDRLQPHLTNVQGLQRRRKVVFYWHKPFADYKDLFGFILPKTAFSRYARGGFNAAWTDCVCG